MPITCLPWVTTAIAAASSTVSESFFIAAFPQAGPTYMVNCGGTLYINVDLANAISFANGGDPIG